MLKLTPVIVGMLAAVSIAQPTFAMSAAKQAVNVNLPASNRQAQLIIKIGGNNGGGYESERDREHRRYERERQIERERWEARRRHMEHERYEHRRGGYDRHDDYHHDGYRR
jgi:hypothetical protein